MQASQKLLEIATMRLRPVMGRAETRRWLEWPVGGWSTTPGKFRVARAALVLAVLVSGAAGGYAANV
ncbi:MAG: hypothetical protein ACRDT0_14925, partial [Pseudonocardiaceae bacterium]